MSLRKDKTKPIDKKQTQISIKKRHNNGQQTDGKIISLISNLMNELRTQCDTISGYQISNSLKVLPHKVLARKWIMSTLIAQQKYIKCRK